MNIHTNSVTTKQCNSHLPFLSKMEFTDSKIPALETSKFNKLSKKDTQKIGDYKLDNFNAIPVSWYKKFTDVNGKPDLITITVLAEIIYQYRALKIYDHLEDNLIIINKFDGEAWLTSYQHFYDKFSFKTDTSRRSLRKLENIGVVRRKVQNVKLKDGSRINKLAIYLDRDFFFSCFVNPNTDIRFNTNDIKEKPLSTDSFASSNPVHTSSWQACQDLISNKNIKNNNRSMKSNFISNNSKEKELEKTQLKATEKHFSIKKIMKKKGFKAKKKLKDFFPLTEEDCSLLQSESGRKFSLTAMNEILQDMSKKVLTPEFWSKKGFMAYMSKAFTGEMRDELKVSNINFKIRNNYTEIDKQEKFLSEIESCMQVTPEWQLKRKLAAMLERNTAYNFLLNYQYSERAGDVYKFYLTNEVSIGAMDKQIILNQVKATQERVGENGNIKSIEKIEFIFSKKKEQRSEKGESEKLAEIKNKEEIKKLPIWLQIRKYFMDYSFDIDARIGVDKCWLSKLTACEDNNKISDNIKTLTLKAESKFIRDWINSNYLFKLESIAKDLGYELLIIE